MSRLGFRLHLPLLLVFFGTLAACSGGTESVDEDYDDGTLYSPGPYRDLFTVSEASPEGTWLLLYRAGEQTETTGLTPENPVPTTVRDTFRSREIAFIERYPGQDLGEMTWCRPGQGRVTMNLASNRPVLDPGADYDLILRNNTRLTGSYRAQKDSTTTSAIVEGVKISDSVHADLGLLQAYGIRRSDGATFNVPLPVTCFYQREYQRTSSVVIMHTRSEHADVSIWAQDGTNQTALAQFAFSRDLVEDEKFSGWLHLDEADGASSVLRVNLSSPSLSGSFSTAVPAYPLQPFNLTDIKTQAILTNSSFDLILDFGLDWTGLVPGS